MDTQTAHINLIAKHVTVIVIPIRPSLLMAV